ncbi:hypothetical protein C0971_07345 [Bacillus methanolicus]|uniref:CsxC family protein n=1 Tax=Bacillus methanolicus TaxID=1471 RepID=UPI00200F3338|nr:hypothetical protein [Bacillus methanolicus]UQD51876.1 hypothetical protein C0971_07345 [Bacillus methanolicus]
MKRNTGCGCNDHNVCPDQPARDNAHTKTVACFNDSFKPAADLQNFPVFDIPTVLAEVELQANVEADIKLPTPAREIKWIRKNVSLKQCKAIPSIQKPGFVKLFITGVVHKNIQFVDDSGFVKDFSVDIPFSCNQQVKVFNHIFDILSRKSSVDERRFLDHNGHGADPCIAGSVTFEYFNEPIECKLLYSEINELDIYKDFDRFGRFDKINEKMEITLFFKLLQTQQFDPRLHDNKPKHVPCQFPPPKKTVPKTARDKFIENIKGMYRIR